MNASDMGNASALPNSPVSNVHDYWCTGAFEAVITGISERIAHVVRVK